MKSRYTALVLAVLVAAAEAGAFAKMLGPLKLAADEKKWEDSLEAHLNEYVDQTVSMLVPVIQEQGLEPMSLPDMTQTFTVTILWMTQRGALSVNNGEMRGLVNVARSGDQRVNYINNKLRLRLQLRFTNLRFVYGYLVTLGNMWYRGGIVGELNRFDFAVDLLIDFNSDELQLQDLSFRNVGRLRVRLTGNPIVDFLATPVVDGFAMMYHSDIFRIVQNNIISTTRAVIDSVNANIKDAVQRLESYGQ